MTLKDDFEGILRDFGHNVLVVRAATETRCSCWNEKTREAQRTCQVCFGMGVVPVIEKHTVRVRDASVPISYPGMNERQPIGDMAVPGLSYYFRSNARLQVGDLIVEVDWSNTGKPIYNGGYVSEISHIDKKRWEGGTVIYQKIYVQDQPIEKQIRGVRISNSNGIVNYELIQGGVS